MPHRWRLQREPCLCELRDAVEGSTAILPSTLRASITLRERLDTQPAAAKVKAQAMDDFDKALSVLKSAIDARRAGDSKVSQARASQCG